MLSGITLRYFKCFKDIVLPLQPLTVLSGTNAAGKSTIMQALLLLHQTMRSGEYTDRLLLNGYATRLGTVMDVVNQAHGRSSIEIGLQLLHKKQETKFDWVFRGEREDMSMEVIKLRSPQDNAWKKNFGTLSYLMPRSRSWDKGIKDAVAAMQLCVGEDLVYLSAERVGPREAYPLHDFQKNPAIVPDGENAVGIIRAFEDRQVTESLCIPDTASTLSRQVEAWMRQFFPHFGMEVEKVKRSNNIILGVRNSDETELLRPANTGFGITQVLPLIIAALSRRQAGPLLVENPESHLHPAAQARMGGFLSQVAAAGVQVILETHSDHILNGIRRAVKAKMLASTDLALYFLRNPEDEKTSKVEKPIIDEHGNLDYWPDGFFDQFDKDAAHFAGWD